MKEYLLKITAYEFEELTDEAQARAIENSRYSEVEHDNWYLPVYEDHTDQLAQVGVADPTIRFSGFFSQGDGACFMSDNINLPVLLAAMKDGGYRVDPVWETEAISGALTVDIQKGTASFCYHYDHSNTITAYAQYVGDLMSSAEVADFEDAVTRWAKKTADSICRDLESFYNELTSDEYISDLLIAGGNLFDQRGNPVIIGPGTECISEE